MFLVPFLRKRFVLASIFASSLIYFIIKTGLLMVLFEWTWTQFYNNEEHQMEAEKLSAHRKIQWLQNAANENKVFETKLLSATDAVVCRNTVQGRHYVTDDRGYTCRRSSLLTSGCCNVFSTNTERFSCQTCSLQIHCCASFENCVSCCLRPEQRSLLENVIRSTNGKRLRLLLKVRDQFQLCLQKCRTSSYSVHQENKYKNSVLKYCYGLEPKLPFEFD